MKGGSKMNSIISKYCFEKIPETATRYILREHSGADIPTFPAVWKKGKNKGKSYIGYRPTQNNRPGHRQFSESISLENNRMFTGFNFDTVHNHKACGDFLTHGVLIEFSTDWKILTIYFIKDAKHEAAAYFEKWVNGELSLTVEKDILPVTGGQKKPESI
jgi:hypothetical protein